MKRILTCLFLIMSVLLLAQENSMATYSTDAESPPPTITGSADRNYVSKAMFTQGVKRLTSVSPARAIITTTFYDGFGRKQQTVLRNNSLGNDLADYYEYDNRGRVVRQYLPGVISGSGNYASLEQITSSHASLYPEDVTKSFISTEYDASVTPRTITTKRAGSDWQTSVGTNSQYHINKGSGKYSCSKYTLNSKIGSLKYSRVYPSGRLHVTSVIDEDNHETIIFKDFNDRIYLHRRVLDENNYADTYYVYDNIGNIRYVIPPMASVAFASSLTAVISDDNEVLQDYCYIYKYDSCNRLEEKKLPGAKSIYYIYDGCDLLRYSQDGNQRSREEWTAYAYDSLYRLAYTCEVEIDAMTIAQLRQTTSFQTTKTELIETANNLGGYTNVIPCGTVKTINAINYYDNYDFLELYPEEKDSIDYKVVRNYDGRYTDTINPQHVNLGMLTGTVTSVIGDSLRLLCANYYDRKGRLIQSCETNHLGGYERKLYRLSFVGNPISIRHEHSTANNSFVDVYNYSYDIQLRPTSVSLAHNGSESMLEFSNTYNSLGQLSNQALGEGLIENTYQYNIQGWITHIDNNKFHQQLYYETHPYGGEKNLTGNVCAMSWSSDGRDNGGNIAPTIQRTYLYDYDRLDRLTSAQYVESEPRSDFTYQTTNTPNYSTVYTYDLNGNITSLRRNGLVSRELADTYELWTFGEVDNVAMIYGGNQLRQINDATEEVILSSTMDVNDRERYNLYDSNGNLFRCPDKDIFYISYNRMNLPDTIYFENNNRIIFKYDAKGRKLREIYELHQFGYPPSMELDPLAINDQQGGLEYYTIAGLRDYCGNYIYQNGSVSMITTPAGYISGSMRYYYLKDYQGNNCVVLNQNGVVQQINHYYPYGSLMGEGYNASSQPYRYGGKELVTLENLNLSDFGARWLDSPSGTFTIIDPLCENFQHLSPFLYCAGNPIKYIDPSGMNWITATYDNYNIYFYDERVQSEEDIKKYYSEDATGISYIGEFTIVVYPKLTIGLLSDGSYMVNAEIQNVEYDNDEIIIGSTLYTDMNTINNNFYGSYLGNSNPRCLDGGYSYASPPINKTDYATFLHDREYDKIGAVGISDALLNYKTLMADLKLVYRLQSNIEYPSLKSTAWKIGASMLFSNVYRLKLNPIFYVILLVEVMKYYIMRKKIQFKYILLCILLILAFNAFWFLACVFGPDIRQHQKYIVPNKCGDDIQQYIGQRILTNSRDNKFIASQTDTLRDSILRYENKILLNDVGLGFSVCVFDDSVFLVRGFCFGEGFKSKHKLQIDSCYYITDYGVDYEGYKAITHAVEDALFGDSIIFKDDTKFYDIVTMEHEIDAKTWYRQRNIWHVVLYKPHLTILIPLIMAIIIGSLVIYYKTK